MRCSWAAVAACTKGPSCASAVAASDRSEGRPYVDACVWRLPGDVPESVRALVLRPCEPPLDCDIVFSSLPSAIARDVEGRFAAAGYPVISNSSSFRMDADVPLVIPEVNPEHLALIDLQRQRTKSGGYIVTNPNCSAVMVALALAPLHRRFGVTRVVA